MSNYSILRIGPIVGDSNNDCCHATVIRDAILSRFQEQQEEDDGGGTSKTTTTTNDNNNTTNNNNKTALLSISNRYFDAHVMLLGMNEESNNSTTNNLNNNNEEEEEDAIEDGIILIFDASLSSSFDTLPIHHTNAISNLQAGELLRLCIGTSYGPSPYTSNGTKVSEDEYSKRVLWCLDNGYEYIEVDLTNEGMKRGFNDRDKDGFARVIEAIGSCMWSSHVMKPRNIVGGGAGRKVDSTTSTTTETVSVKDLSKKNDGNNDNDISTTKDNNNDEDEEEDELSETSTTASSLPDDYAEREKAAISNLMKDMTIGEEHSSNDPQQKQEGEDKKEEMAFHQLESVISEARSLREASKGNSMSDDERRARAGDTAMKLMGLLGSMGFDGDDSSTDDDEEEGQCDSSDVDDES